MPVSHQWKQPLLLLNNLYILFVVTSGSFGTLPSGLTISTYMSYPTLRHRIADQCDIQMNISPMWLAHYLECFYKMNCAFLPKKKSYVEVVTTSTSEYDHIWSLYRGIKSL